MRRSRLIFGRRPRAAGGDGFASRARSLILFSCLALAVFAVGCVSHRLPDFQRGTTCSAENVQRYAAEHKLSYDQALAELRKQDEQLWEEEEARQAKRQRGRATPATEKTVDPNPDNQGP